VRQFVRGLRPALTAGEVAEVRTLLTPAEFDLFRRAEPRDRRHSVDLLHLLCREGVGGAAPSSEMLVAALLHDVGKGPLRTSDRVLFVVLQAALPAVLDRVAKSDAGHRRAALWRLRHHATLSADRLREAGSAERVIEIVAAHTGAPSVDPEIAAFIRADDRV
jgi:putative nucleotidyltransferase with HDIG domain